MVFILMPKVLTPLALFVIGSFFLATSESNHKTLSWTVLL